MPQRTCVGCRRVAPWSDLVRLGLTGDATLSLVPGLPGRGAWLCAGRSPGVPRVDCLEQAARRNSFGRALRAPISAEAVETLRRSVQERERIESGAAAGDAPRRD